MLGSKTVGAFVVSLTMLVFVAELRAQVPDSSTISSAGYQLDITKERYATVSVVFKGVPANVELMIGGKDLDYGKDIRGLRATGQDQRSLSITALPRIAGQRLDQVWRLDSRAGETVHLDYVIVCSKSDHEGLDDEESATHRPSLFSDWAFLFGHAAFVIPRTEVDHTTLDISIPAGWPMVSSFGKHYATQDVSQLHWLTFGAGNYQIRTKRLADAEIQLAVMGLRRFDIDTIFEQFVKLINVQHDIFKFYPVDRCVVTILPAKDGH